MNRRPRSFWIETATPAEYAPLSGDRTFDVAVLGGGLCGITTALMLKTAGARVAVVEANRIGSGATGYTTGKLSSLHGLIYRKLVSTFGEDDARLYGEANEAAIDAMERLVDEHGIDCDFRRKPNFTMACSDGNVDALREEAEIARRLGLPASFTTDVDLPFDVAGAVRFERQAEFHPVKYLAGLARLIPGEGSEIFQQTTATDVDEGPPLEVTTPRGTIRADHVVVATHFPFLDRGGQFARMHVERSYVVACRVRGDLPQAMYISVDPPTRSIRTTPCGDEELLLVGGEGHKVGEVTDTEACYDALEEWTRRHFDVVSLDWGWSAQDPIPADSVPYIGKLHPGAEHLWLATGFAKWGLAHSTAAAEILTDQVLGRPNRWASLYDATRGKPAASASDVVKQTVSVVKHFVGDRLAHRDPAAGLEDLSSGVGAIVERDGEDVAAYRDDDGELHVVSATCTHMGCNVAWNGAEQSWDCACHGSRFAIDGSVLEGPAVAPLEARDASGATASTQRRPLEA